ncbi:hypothetical protein PRO82_000130 [Candidatus Protochlamydia amoebophila]|nr:hypothetical protein [Candidatus Protochlamydia amoebophila]
MSYRFEKSSSQLVTITQLLLFKFRSNELQTKKNNEKFNVFLLLIESFCVNATEYMTNNFLNLLKNQFPSPNAQDFDYS